MSSVVNEFRIFHVLPENIRNNIRIFNIPESDRAICVTNNDQVYVLGEKMKRMCGYKNIVDENNYELISEICGQNVQEFWIQEEFMFSKTADNKIFACGQYVQGQLGIGIVSRNEEYIKPKLIDFFGDINIVEISCGYTHCLALSENGLVYGWGNNNYIGYQQDNPDTTKSASIPFLFDNEFGINEKVRSIYCHQNNSLLLSVTNIIYISIGKDWNFIIKIDRFKHNFRSYKKSIEQGDLITYQDSETIKSIKLKSLIERIGFIASSNDKLDKIDDSEVDSLQNKVDKIFDKKPRNTKRKKKYVSAKERHLRWLDKHVYRKIIEKNKNYFKIQNQLTYKTIHIKDNGIYVKKYEFNENPNSPQIILQEYMKTIYQDIDDVNKNRLFILSFNTTLNKFQFANNQDKFETSVKYYHQINGYTSSDFSAIFVMKDNKVYGIGDKGNGILGLGHNKSVMEYTLIPELCDQNIVEFFKGFDCMFARSDKNDIFGWGKNDYGQLGLGFTSELVHKPAKISFFNKKNIIQINAFKIRFYALSSDGYVYGWGKNWGKKWGVDWLNIGPKNYHNSLDVINDFSPIGCANYNKLILSPKKIHFIYQNNKMKINFIHWDDRCNNCLAVTSDGKAFIWGATSKFGDIFLDSQKFTLRYIPGITKLDNVSKIFPIDLFTFNNKFYTITYLVILKTSNTLMVYCDNAQDPEFTSENVRDVIHHKIDHKNLIIHKEDGVYQYNIELKSITKTYYSNFFEYFLYKYERILETIHLSSDGYLMTHQMQVNPNYSQNSDQKLLTKTMDNIFDNKYDKTFTEEVKIGTGSFGKVFKVKHHVSSQSFAIKRMEIKDHLADIIREVEIMSKLSDDFVVKYINSWTEGKVIFWNKLTNFMYIQMELCPQNFKSLIDTINQSFDERFKTIQYFLRTELFVELIECLNHLHSQIPPILHRDLKPENVLATDGSNGRFLKLCDFGLSKFFETSQNSRGVGTRYYTAPEVYDEEDQDSKSDKSHYDLKSDIYSLGVIAIKLFDFKDSIRNIRKKQVMEKYLDPFLNSKFEEIFRILFELISVMVSKKPEKRPDCEELLKGINRWTVNQSTVETDETFLEFQSIVWKQENQILKNIIKTKLSNANR